MIVDEITYLLDNPDAAVDESWLDNVRQQYPYFTLPMLMAVKRAEGDVNSDLLERLAIASPDRRSLALITGRNSDIFDAFYPPQAPEEAPDTDDTIDRFLQNYGSNNPREIEAINNAIFNPMPDYADILVAQEQQQNPARQVEAQTKEDELIDKFIALSQQQEQAAANAAVQHHPEAGEIEEVAGEEVSIPTINDDSMLSESLAKLYIAQHKYSKALEIIENINLNFPEKSIYFADQIRYLRKLIWLNDKRN